MDNRSETSPSGSPIYRHQPRERSFELPEHSCRNLEDIEAHIEKHIGKIEWVFHELVSDLVHLDVLFVKATKERPYHVLVTSGVSDEAMNVPKGMENFARAELLIALPEDWPLTQADFKDGANYWPVFWLKQIGRLPHDYNTWIGWGHTIPNGDPPQPIENTSFTGVVLEPPFWLPAEFFQLTTQAGDLVSFYDLVPLYFEEMQLKLKLGVEELEKRFERAEIGFVLDPHRPNVAQTE
jgi:hypothetical protein